MARAKKIFKAFAPMRIMFGPPSDTSLIDDLIDLENTDLRRYDDKPPFKTLGASKGEALYGDGVATFDLADWDPALVNPRQAYDFYFLWQIRETEEIKGYVFRNATVVPPMIPFPKHENSLIGMEIKYECHEELKCNG